MANGDRRRDGFREDTYRWIHSAQSEESESERRCRHAFQQLAAYNDRREARFWRLVQVGTPVAVFVVGAMTAFVFSGLQQNHEDYLELRAEVRVLGEKISGQTHRLERLERKAATAPPSADSLAMTAGRDGGTGQ